MSALTMVFINPALISRLWRRFLKNRLWFECYEGGFFCKNCLWILHKFYFTSRTLIVVYPLLDLPCDLHYSVVTSAVCRNLHHVISSASLLWPISLSSHRELPSIAGKLCCAVSSNFMVLEYNFFLFLGRSFVIVFIYMCLVLATWLILLTFPICVCLNPR